MKMLMVAVLIAVGASPAPADVCGAMSSGLAGPGQFHVTPPWVSDPDGGGFTCVSGGGIAAHQGSDPLAFIVSGTKEEVTQVSVDLVVQKGVDKGRGLRQLVAGVRAACSALGIPEPHRMEQLVGAGAAFEGIAHGWDFTVRHRPADLGQRTLESFSATLTKAR